MLNKATKNKVNNLDMDYFIVHGKGKGEALRLAISRVQSDIIVFIDGDGSHDLNDIPKLVGPIKNEEADMVIASRIMGGGGSEELDNWRKLFTIIINLIINMRFNKKITDYQNGFRAIKTAVAKDMMN